MASLTVDWHEVFPDAVRSGAVTVGNFDGVHRGHQSLLTVLREQARRVGGPAVALTFDPHPLTLLRPGTLLPQLTRPADRDEQLHACGADHVVTLHSTSELLHLSAGDFFRQVLRNRLEVRALVEGTNFGFGYNREGSVDTLAGLCAEADLPLTVVPPLRWQEGPVSSSRIRTALLAGSLAEANELLGRAYRLRGRVTVGQRRGRTIGFPTANLTEVGSLVPGDGVYAVRVHLAGAARTWAGAANVGPNPTFGEDARKVEVHVLDFQGDLYGQELAVDFLTRLRDTRPFGSPAELVAQLSQDVEAARRQVGEVPSAR